MSEAIVTSGKIPARTAAVRAYLEALPLMALPWVSQQVFDQAAIKILSCLPVSFVHQPNGEVKVSTLVLGSPFLADAVFGLCVVLFLRLRVPWLERACGDHVDLRALVDSALKGIAFSALCLGLVWWDQGFLPVNVYRGFFGQPSLAVLPMLIVLGVATAVVEELYFRGALYRISRGFWSTRSSTALNVITFTAIHTWAYGNPLMLSVISAAGLVCVRYMETTRSILPGAAFHALMNVVWIVGTNSHLYGLRDV